MRRHRAPIVSVSMPVYNGMEFLDATIESVLAQTLTDFEFIIVDDGSTDGSWERLTEWAKRDSRISAYRNDKNSGHRATSNRGFGLARGKYVARTDQDDLSLPRRLEAQVSMMEQSPSLGLVGSGYQRLYPDGRVTEHRPAANHAALRWVLLFDLPFPHSSLMFRRDLLGGAAAYRFAPATYDYEICARLARHAVIGAVSETLVVYRCHATGMSAKQKLRMETGAAAISARQVRRLLAPRRLRRPEFAMLRRWSRPRSVLAEDLSAGLLFLDLLHAFSHLPDVGTSAGADIKKAWIQRLARDLPPTLWPSLLGTPLARALLRDDPIAVGRALLASVPRRISRRLFRSISRRSQAGLSQEP